METVGLRVHFKEEFQDRFIITETLSKDDGKEEIGHGGIFRKREQPVQNASKKILVPSKNCRKDLVAK